MRARSVARQVLGIDEKVWHSLMHMEYADGVLNAVPFNRFEFDSQRHPIQQALEESSATTSWQWIT